MDGAWTCAAAENEAAPASILTEARALTSTNLTPSPPGVQDGGQEGCADSGEAGAKLKPQLNEQQLKDLLTRGKAAEAKVGGRVGRVLGAAPCLMFFCHSLGSWAWVSLPCTQLAQLPIFCLPYSRPAKQVLRFTGGIERLFGGWADGGAGERFKRRVDHYAAIWCCVNKHPGHVWCAPSRLPRCRV